MTNTGPWTITLPYGRIPAGLSANDRGHWGQKAQSTAMVRMGVMYLVRAQKVPALEKIRVDVEWVVNTKHRRDTDNAFPLLKAIFDGIGADKGVSARIVEDDAPAFMDKRGLTIRYAQDEKPRFIVTITDIGDLA